jgi:hypothetical protein
MYIRSATEIIKIEMKGGINKIMRNITASAAAKTEFEKVGIPDI